MSAGVMLIPAPTPPLPIDAHLTLVYAGEEPESYTIERLATLARIMSKRHPAFTASVSGAALFGANGDEPVLLIEMTSEIATMRASVSAFSRSNYTEFRPHIAVPRLFLPSERWWTKLPRLLYFNKIALWSGDYDHREYWLGS